MLDFLKVCAVYLGNIVFAPMIFVYVSCFLLTCAVMLFWTTDIIQKYIGRFILNRYTAITRRIHLPKHRTPKQFSPSISFMGGGHLWMFAIGAGHYIYENYDLNSIKFLASSCGCFAAVPLACGLDPYEWCKRDWSKCMKHFESRGILSCFFDSKHFYYQLWDDYLPENAHIRCSGRFFISVTRVPSMKNHVVSHFETREDLIWAVVGKNNNNNKNISIWILILFLFYFM
jgi:hypothetical protein